MNRFVSWKLTARDPFLSGLRPWQSAIELGNARPLDQALQHATNDMFNWLMLAYGLSKTAASHLLGQVVRYEVGNVYDPAYIMVGKVEKKWLPRR